MPSFDVVSKVDAQEVDNAINQAIKEVQSRYDLKGSKSSIEWKAKEEKVVLSSDDERRLAAVKDILQSKLIKRGVDIKNLDFGKVEPMGGQTLRQEVKVESGINKENAKKIIDHIKQTKLKVQAQVMDDQVRVTAKSIDDLQAVIATLRSASNIETGLQFINMKS